MIKMTTSANRIMIPPIMPPMRPPLLGVSIEIGSAAGVPLVELSPIDGSIELVLAMLDIVVVELVGNGCDGSVMVALVVVVGLFVVILVDAVDAIVSVDVVIPLVALIALVVVVVVVVVVVIVVAFVVVDVDVAVVVGKVVCGVVAQVRFSQMQLPIPPLGQSKQFVSIAY